ncbi:hypothetical protein ACFL1N_08205 [Thermodesulfobacteriota bacterium]
MTQSKRSILFACLFIFGISLRLMLYWQNPVFNSFDDHYEPILKIFYEGIPAKDACYQCYHPPIFYYLSAMVGKLVSNDILRLKAESVFKLWQLIPCLFGILHLILIYLILERIKVSEFSKILTFATACFLPRHIYMSVLHSNDTISYFFVGLCVYLLLIAIDRKFPPSLLILLSLSITITIFTKYTAFIILPVVVTTALLVFVWNMFSRRKIATLLLTLVAPLFLLSLYTSSNIKKYGTPLPRQNIIAYTNVIQPQVEKISYISFKPWETINPLIITPDNIGSFWTLIYSRTFWDLEPRFLLATDPGPWWDDYYNWLSGRSTFPSTIQLSNTTVFTGSSLITLGLIPLLFIMIGGYQSVFGRWSVWNRSYRTEALKVHILLVIFIFNVIGIVYWVSSNPVYSTMKAAYFLNSLPALMVFMCLGLMLIEKIKAIKCAVIIVFIVLFTIVIWHILHIIISL